MSESALPDECLASSPISNLYSIGYLVMIRLYFDLFAKSGAYNGIGPRSEIGL